mmetsp:Transcript_2543/g.6885  ORF Transcript_2543/g.6885 Transcript_2543/m.6885 type:complete len:359 (-) Transcript_2543:868-1944(-)
MQKERQMRQEPDPLPVLVHVLVVRVAVAFVVLPSPGDLPELRHHPRHLPGAEVQDAGPSHDEGQDGRLVGKPLAVVPAVAPFSLLLLLLLEEGVVGELLGHGGLGHGGQVRRVHELLVLLGLVLVTRKDRSAAALVAVVALQDLVVDPPLNSQEHHAERSGPGGPDAGVFQRVLDVVGKNGVDGRLLVPDRRGRERLLRLLVPPHRPSLLRLRHLRRRLLEEELPSGRPHRALPQKPVRVSHGKLLDGFRVVPKLRGVPVGLAAPPLSGPQGLSAGPRHVPGLGGPSLQEQGQADPEHRLQVPGIHLGDEGRRIDVGVTEAGDRAARAELGLELPRLDRQTGLNPLEELLLALQDQGR